MNTFKFGGGTFYMSDGCETIGFTPYPIDGVFTLEEPEFEDFKTLINPRELLGEITFTTTVDYRTYLSLYHSRKVTNNWLKMMPGGIMGRKTKRRGLKLRKD